jgi:hypothetical protein
MFMVTDLVHFAHCIVDGENTTYIVIAFSSFRPVAKEARQTARWRSAHCHDVDLSLGLYIQIANLSI